MYEWLCMHACINILSGERISYFSLTAHQPILQRKLRMPRLDGISHLVFLKTWDSVLGDTQNYFQCFRGFCVYLFFVLFTAWILQISQSFMPLSLLWSSGATKYRRYSKESLPSHCCQGRIPPLSWSWSSGRAGRYMLKPWGVGRCLTEGSGLGEPPPGVSHAPWSRQVSVIWGSTIFYTLGRIQFP